MYYFIFHFREACQLFFKQDPLKITRASKQYMYDEKGHAYLDCINNVCHGTYMSLYKYYPPRLPQTDKLFLLTSKSKDIVHSWYQ